MLRSWFLQLSIMSLMKLTPAESFRPLHTLQMGSDLEHSAKVDSQERFISYLAAYVVEDVLPLSKDLAIKIPEDKHLSDLNPLLQNKRRAATRSRSTENTSRRLLGLMSPSNRASDTHIVAAQNMVVSTTPQDVTAQNMMTVPERSVQLRETERPTESAIAASLFSGNKMEHSLGHTTPVGEVEAASDATYPRHLDSLDGQNTIATLSVERFSGSLDNVVSGTTLRPQEERECIAGLVCLHGHCDLLTFSCLCDPGWFGPVCDVTCVPACPEHGICETTEKDKWKPVCVCDKNRPETCDRDGSPINSTLLPPHSTETVTTITTTTTANQTNETDPQTLSVWDPLEGYGPLAPLSWRKCAGSPDFFECRYGNCTFENNTMLCICEANFSDQLCDKPCLLDCGGRGVCAIQHSTGREDCLCYDHRYRGFNCSTLYEPLKDSHQLSQEVQAAFAVVAVLVVILMMLLVVVYVLWRRRNITMMRIVYWFQSFEEDDDRDCDAFVSYASADLDREFVVQVLVPRLENQMCFSLCVHQRDFLPGQYISNNISESVKRSRRTIMVLTPAYVNSDWCRFEFQMALQEMISQKHRILPILLHDVSSLKKDMDETLKRVLEAVTWIKYPTEDSNDKEFDQFWKRIALSMPKRRLKSPEQGENNSSYTSLTALSQSPESKMSHHRANKNNTQNTYVNRESRQCSEMSREHQIMAMRQVLVPEMDFAADSLRSSQQKKKSFFSNFIHRIRRLFGDSNSNQPRVVFGNDLGQDKTEMRVEIGGSGSIINAKTKHDKLNGCRGDEHELHHKFRESVHKQYHTICEHPQNIDKDKNEFCAIVENCDTKPPANSTVDSCNVTNHSENPSGEILMIGKDAH